MPLALSSSLSYKTSSVAGFLLLVPYTNLSFKKKMVRGAFLVPLYPFKYEFSPAISLITPLTQSWSLNFKTFSVAGLLLMLPYTKSILQQIMVRCGSLVPLWPFKWESLPVIPLITPMALVWSLNYQTFSVAGLLLLLPYIKSILQLIMVRCDSLVPFRSFKCDFPPVIFLITPPALASGLHYQTFSIAGFLLLIP